MLPFSAQKSETLNSASLVIADTFLGTAGVRYRQVWLYTNLNLLVYFEIKVPSLDSGQELILKNHYVSNMGNPILFNLLKKLSRKDKYWHNHFRNASKRLINISADHAQIIK